MLNSSLVSYIVNKLSSASGVTDWLGQKIQNII